MAHADANGGDLVLAWPPPHPHAHPVLASLTLHVELVERVDHPLLQRREDRVGVWVRRGAREDKIAAIGIRVRHWVTFHGISINVEPDLSHFGGIVPCGIREHGVTSLVDLGLPVTMADLDVALKKTFQPIFGAAP